MTINNPCNYFAMALDPIHVGSGRQGLGRVDLPIVREAATNLPIIPGSSICGVTRAAVAINKDKYPLGQLTIFPLGCNCLTYSRLITLVADGSAFDFAWAGAWHRDSGRPFVQPPGCLAKRISEGFFAN